MPDCSCVIRFDLPKTARSYIQSHGRARQAGSHYVIMLERYNDPAAYNIIYLLCVVLHLFLYISLCNSFDAYQHISQLYFVYSLLPILKNMQPLNIRGCIMRRDPMR